MEATWVERNGGEGPNWYALFTRHQHEKSVAHALGLKGFDVYLPLYRVLHRWQDREKQLWLPLFSCYVFLCGGMDRQLQVLTTPGLLHVVGPAGRPAIVPTDQLDAVRQMVESPLRVEPHPFLSSGDRVRVISGPLFGLQGILTRTKAATRLVVSVEMLGRSAAVEIDAAQVEKIGPSQPRELARSMSASTWRERSWR
jgi:transcription antitermination factor NusG